LWRSRGQATTLVPPRAGLAALSTEVLRSGRRARVIQNLMRTIGPLVGIIVTATGSLYTGLKGIIGW